MIRTDADRPSVQHDDETGDWFIRASALGGCTRALIAAGRGLEGEPTPDWMQEKFDEGHANEPIIAAMALDRTGGVRIVAEPGKQHPVELGFNLHEGIPPLPSIIVSGTLDDLVMEDRDIVRWTHPDHGYEYKALGPSYCDKIRAAIRGTDNPDEWAARVLAVLPANYAWQLSAYMHGAAQVYGKMLAVKLFVGVKNDEGVVIEVMEPFVFHEPPHSLAEIEARVRAVVGLAADLGAEFPKCDVNQYPCPFYLLHDDEEIPELEGDDAINMRLFADSLVVAKGMIEAGEKMKKDANEGIKAILANRKTVIVPSGDSTGMEEQIRVTWVSSEVAESTRTVKAHTRSYPNITRKKV